MHRQIIGFCWILQLLYSINGFGVPKSSNRIIGGRPAPDGHAPFQCSLQIDSFHFCGCSIISDKWVVTAAHCNRSSPENYEILVGTNNLETGGTRYQVDKFICHEKYDEVDVENDIAVVRVDRPFQFNRKVQPIDFSPVEVPERTKLELTGWGVTNDGLLTPEYLQLIELNSFPFKECEERWPNLTAAFICTFTRPGEGACHGDSGGGLVWRRDSKVQLIGVVSYGEACAEGFPDVYADVSYFYDWITKHISSSK